jgi:hypothetical protein
MRLLPLLALLLLPACLPGAVPMDLAVSISPDSAAEGTPLQAVVDVAPTGDFDELSYVYEWLEDGATVDGLTSDTVPGDRVQAGEIWRVVVYPFNGEFEGLAASDQITIEGAPTGDPDDDGDGSPASLDCDDDDPDRYPDAVDTCDGVDTDCDPTFPPGDVDVDGDEVPACEDCDDSDPDRFPGNPVHECLEGVVSSDCEPLENAELTGWTPDVDGDGDGEADVEAWYLCAWDDPGPGWVTSPIGDCDDLDPVLNSHDDDGDGQSTCEGDIHPDGSSADDDPDLFPSQTEVCNGVDDDLDGEVDEGFDLDGDGSFDGGDAECALNYPASSLDCDDEDPTLNSVDADGDGETTCAGDCDDGDPSMNKADADADGASSCDLDCDDGNPALNLDDADNDGFTTCQGDCDDGEANAFPGNSVQCDGIDDTDCDGSTDILEADVDGDGTSTCEGDCDDGDAALTSADADDDGFSTCAGDCDDAEPSVWPGAPPLCDGILDNDCNGAADANEADGDGDGSIVCDGDCDDSNADLEALDNDGDGFTTCDGDCDDANASLTPTTDDDGDGWGVCESPLGPADCDDTDSLLNHSDVDADGFTTCEAAADCDDFDPTASPADDDFDGETSCEGDCDDGDDAINSYSSETRDGLDNDCDGTADEGLISPGDVAVVELMVSAGSGLDAHAEYVEVFNTSNLAIDLRGWTIEVTGQTQTDSATTLWGVDATALVVEAGGRFLLARSSNATAYGVDVADGWLGLPALPDSGASLSLSFAETVIDELTWGPSDCVLNCEAGQPSPTFAGDNTYRTGHAIGMNAIPSQPAIGNDSLGNWCEEQTELVAGTLFGSPGVAPTVSGACFAN